MNIEALLKGRQAWQKFSANHPNFPPFLEAVKARKLPLGTQVTIVVDYPDGEQMKAGIKVKESDLELLEMLRNI